MLPSEKYYILLKEFLEPNYNSKASKKTKTTLSYGRKIINYLIKNDLVILYKNQKNKRNHYYLITEKGKIILKHYSSIKNILSKQK